MQRIAEKYSNKARGDEEREDRDLRALSECELCHFVSYLDIDTQKGVINCTKFSMILLSYTTIKARTETVLA